LFQADFTTEDTEDTEQKTENTGIFS